MFYFDRQSPDVLFCDIRNVDDVQLCDGRHFSVKPDVVLSVKTFLSMTKPLHSLCLTHRI